MVMQMWMTSNQPGSVTRLKLTFEASEAISQAGGVRANLHKAPKVCEISVGHTNVYKMHNMSHMLGRTNI